MNNQKFECDGDVCRLISTSEEVEENNVETLPEPLDEGYTIYGAEWCPFCRKAKMYLASRDIPFVYHDIDEYERNDVLSKLGTWTDDFPTIPKVFHDKKFIGGYSDLVKTFNSELTDKYQ